MRINEGDLKIITRKKNTIPHLKEHCPKIDDILLVIIRFFFSQTSPVFIDILDTFCHSLSAFLPFDFRYSTYFRCSVEFIQWPYVFFIKTSKVLSTKMFLLCLNFYEIFFPVNGENKFWSLCYLYKSYIYARSLFCKQILKRNIDDCNKIFYVCTSNPQNVLNLLSFFTNFSQFLCSDTVLLWQLQQYNVFI